MKKLLNEALDWIKKEDIEGCITGSCLLDYFEGQDIDVFVYNEGALNKLLFSLYYNKMFQILDPLEKWKFEEWINKKQSSTSSLKKFGLITIKFYYNLSIPINIIYKKNKYNVFDVISTFDMNIICKGYDLKTKQYLDLTGNPGKKADWNKWNTSFYANDIWTLSRLLRQFQRCIKYHKRGYNTDLITLKYLNLVDKLLEYKNIFNSVSFDEKLDLIKSNASILKKIFISWLNNHKITEKEEELLKIKIKEL